MAIGQYDYQYDTSPRKIEPKVEEKPKTTVKVKNEVLQIKNKKDKRKVILSLAVIFGVLLLISYRNSIITERFSQKENKKEEYNMAIKANQQLTANIESSLSLANVSEVAKTTLGMQAYSTTEKVYVSLPKKDYVEATSEGVVMAQNKSYIENFIDKLLEKI